MRPALIDRYRDLLPVDADTPVVSLGEGDTPLVSLPRLSERLGVRLYAKLKGMNPTASFKDRA
jgi:threonine synthase